MNVAGTPGLGPSSEGTEAPVREVILTARLGTQSAWAHVPSPCSLQREWTGHHLPVELEPDMGKPGQPVGVACSHPGPAAVVTHQPGLLLTEHLSW